MAKDKYISLAAKTNGFTFANIGLFYGLGSTIFTTVYSLILLDIFKSSAAVGLYSAIFACFAMLFSVFSSEIFRVLPKARILPISLITIIITTFAMVFQVSQGSFIALDVVRECSWALLSMCLTLFMAEFAGPIGVAQVSGRYYTLNNIGSLIAPVIALQVAVIFGNDRVPLILVSIIMLIALFYFKDYRVVAADKNAKIATADKTVKKIFGNFREFAKNKSLVNAFITNYGYYAIYSIRSLYVPISVVEAGFTKDILGFILMIGTLPFVLLASPISKFAKKHGCKWILSIGFIAFAICAMMATFSGGLFLLGLFVLWQIPNAMLEPVKELPFYSNATKSQQSKFVGIFKTSSYLAKVITPLIGAFAIWLTGYTASVWLVAAAFAIIAAKFSNQESKKGL